MINEVIYYSRKKKNSLITLGDKVIASIKMSDRVFWANRWDFKRATAKGAERGLNGRGASRYSDNARKESPRLSSFRFSRLSRRRGEAGGGTVVPTTKCQGIPDRSGTILAARPPSHPGAEESLASAELSSRISTSSSNCFFSFVRKKMNRKKKKIGKK